MIFEKLIKGWVSWVKDIIDKRDYPYEYLFGSTQEIIWEKIIDLKNDYQDQNIQERSYYMCVPTSTVHWDNIMNSIQWDNSRTTLLELWNNMVNLWRLNIKSWALLKDWPKTMIELGRLKWTALISTIWGYIDSINNNRPVVLGSELINWNKTTNSFYAIKWNWYAHCFLWIWYNEKWMICKNTLWKKWWLMWGKFILKWQDFNLLFNSKISMINNDNDIFDKIKNMKLLLKNRINTDSKFNLYRDWIKEYLDTVQKNSIEYKINKVAILSLLGMVNLVKECMK